MSEKGKFMKVLMPIHPSYAFRILEGTKKYEYRKTRPKKSDVHTMLIYATSPIMKILGEVEIKEILEETPEHIWKQTSQYGGITKTSYDDYFKNRDKAIAIALGKVTSFKHPKTLLEYHIDYHPQSYNYIEDDIY